MIVVARIDELHAEIHSRLQEFGWLTGNSAGGDTIAHYAKMEAARSAKGNDVRRPVHMSEVVSNGS